LPIINGGRSSFERRNYFGLSNARLAYTTDEEFAGEIDDVKLWSVERTLAQIQASIHGNISPTEPGLIAAWDFDDGTARDASDNGFTRTLQGKAKIAPTNRPQNAPGPAVLFGKATGPDGSPLRNATIHLRRPGLEISQTTGRDGSYGFAFFQSGLPFDMEEDDANTREML
jgi:hypothetical protein